MVRHSQAQSSLLLLERRQDRQDGTSYDLQQTGFIATRTGYRAEEGPGTGCKLRAQGFILGSEGGAEGQCAMDMGKNGAKEGLRVRSANRETGVEKCSKLGAMEGQREENILGTNQTWAIGVELG